LIAEAVGIDHLEGAVTVTGIEPAAVRCDAIGSGVIVVHCARPEELDADETGNRPLEGVAFRVDDVDARVRAIAQIVFRAVWVNPADVE
jgi:hypothetical protein